MCLFLENKVNIPRERIIEGHTFNLHPHHFTERTKETETDRLLRPHLPFGKTRRWAQFIISERKLDGSLVGINSNLLR